MSTEATHQQVGNRLRQRYQQWKTGTAAVAYFLDKTPGRAEDLSVFVDGLLKRPKEKATAYDYAWDGKTKVTFTVAPNGLNVCFLVETV